MSTTTGWGSYLVPNSIFSLNIISNMGALFNGQPAATIVQNTGTAIGNILADSQIQSYVGTWSLAWGPAIKVSDANDCENTMYIAYNSDLNAYAVLIAGTDSSSITDKLIEDLDVWDKKPWPYYTNMNKALQPNVSDGALAGFNDLLALTDPATGLTALQYLQDNVASDTTVYVSGHSLGGTLSPLMALYLVTQIQGLNVICVPVAGLTCGDENFVNYYNSTSLGANTICIANSIDIFTHLFEYTLVEELKPLYNPYIDWDPLLDPGIFYAEESAKRNNYQQIGQPSFTSNLFVTADVQYPIYVGNPEEVDPGCYGGQALCQHVAGYAYGLDVADGFLARTTTVFGDSFPGLISGTYFTVGCSAPTGASMPSTAAKQPATLSD